MDFLTIQVGDKAAFHWDEFDGRGTIYGVVTKTYPDHVIIQTDGEKLWCDDDNIDMFNFFSLNQTKLYDDKGECKDGTEYE